MKKTVIFFLLAFYGSFVSAQCPIIPTPQEYSHIDLKIPLGKELRLDSTSIDRTSWNYLKSHLKLQTGIELVHDGKNPFIVFQFKNEAHLKPEGWPISMEYEIRSVCLSPTHSEARLTLANKIAKAKKKEGFKFID